MQTATIPPSESLRILCLDGGGIKGYTTLLILKRILRTMLDEGSLTEIPRPCNFFDLIIGTSTGGLIAVMLGRLHMTIDECIAKYEQVGREVFGKKPPGGQFGKIFKGLKSSSFYDIRILQEEVRKALDSKGISRDTSFLEGNAPMCKVMLCVTRTETSKPDVLRNYESRHPTAENYNCRIWEAASATAAAPMYFKPIQFDGTREKWSDGGLRRNNPINEALSEISRERDWENKKIGCVLSLGTGVAKSEAVSSNLAGFLKGAVAIMADSDDIARVFASSEFGIELTRTRRYFRFSVPQGMQDLQLDEWKETEKMRALTTDYLSHMAIGELVKQCAKSLLYPDENLQVGIKPKRFLLPNNPCTHFVERRAYTDALSQFFKPHLNHAQIFVLWGLGGIGKTQIALKFAQSMKHRLSVFWIRADRFTNFAADYVQILTQLDLSGSDNHAPTKDDVSMTLEKTRRKLEEMSGEWLLILDNADDLDEFLGRGTKQENGDEFSISKFIPRQGRVLITTRDRRFQGTVASASDGMRVDPMDENEAQDLLIASVPGYLIKNTSESLDQAKQLVAELGFLPLAIAQAAANILEQQLTLAEYVRFYNDKKYRMRLMQTAAHDFQNTDPRNASQSVHVTWQISFDILKDKFPLSATFLSYIGCFHWQHIPRQLLQLLPEFRDLAEPTFIQLTKKPLNLSLVEEYDETDFGFIEYSVHPLVHDNILGRLTPSEIGRYLEPAIDLLSSTFPVVSERASNEWNLAVYLAPHAVRQVELAEEVGVSSKSLTSLLLALSYFFGQSNLFQSAIDLAYKALAMGSGMWGSNEYQLVVLRQNVISQLTDASRLEDAEREARSTIEWVNSEAVKGAVDDKILEKQNIRLQSLLSMVMLGRQNHNARLEIHQQQLATGLINEKSLEGLTIKHNLAHTLLKQHKIKEAMAINRELLEFAESDEGKSVVSTRLYLIMLNLKALILHTCNFRTASEEGHLELWSANPEEKMERLRIHELVFKLSAEKLGIEDIDTWKAFNNLVGFYNQNKLYTNMGQIFPDVLRAGLAAKITVDGKFRNPLSEITENAGHYLEFLVASEGEKSAIAVEFAALLAEWITCSGSAPELNHSHSAVNTEGVAMQHKGRFEKAEKLHRRAIELCLLEGIEQVCDVYWYNLMLVVGRQGRIEEALALRDEYKIEIETAELAFGTLEARWERDKVDLEVYKQAQKLIAAGGLSKDSEWWHTNQNALSRAENRYGFLDRGA